MAEQRRLRATLDGDVTRIERARIGHRAGEVTDNAEAAQQDSARYGPTYAALRELGIPVLHSPGVNLTGVGIDIGILDSGFYTSHATLRGLRVVAQRDFVDDDDQVAPEPGDAPNQARHGTHV